MGRVMKYSKDNIHTHIRVHCACICAHHPDLITHCTQMWQNDVMRFAIVSSWPSLLFGVVGLMGHADFFPSSLCSFILNGKSLFSRLIWRGKITLWRNYIIESEINNKWIIGWKVTMPKVNITNTRTQTHSNKTVWDFFGIYHVTQCVLLLLPLLLLAKHVYTWIDGVLIFRSWEYLSRLKPNCVMILAYKHEMDWLLYYQYWRQTTTIR